MTINTDLVSVFRETLDKVLGRVESYSGTAGTLKETIVANFGQPGLIAAYIIVAVLALTIVLRLLKIAFAAIKYIVIPAVALALIASFFLPYSFETLLPVTATIGSLFLLFKG